MCRKSIILLIFNNNCMWITTKFTSVIKDYEFAACSTSMEYDLWLRESIIKHYFIFFERKALKHYLQLRST